MSYEQEPPKKTLFQQLRDAVTGKKQVTPLAQQFEQLYAEQQRLEREAQAARKQEDRELLQADRLREQEKARMRRAAKQGTRQREQSNARARQLGWQECDALRREFRNTPLNKLAESIKRTWWRNPHVRVAVSEDRHPDITLAPDGTVSRNLSAYGVRLSYSHQDLVYRSREVFREVSGEMSTTSRRVSEGFHDVPVIETVQQTLTYGIGNFGRADVVPEARAGISDADSVRAWYIRQSNFEARESVSGEPRVMDENVDTVYAFPVTFPSYQVDFQNRLLESIKQLSPNEVVPQATQRVQAYRQYYRLP